MREAEFDTAGDGTTDGDVSLLLGATPIDESCSRERHLSQKCFDASVVKRNLPPAALCNAGTRRRVGTDAQSIPAFFGGRP
jgi:hypothetical protein